MNSLDVAAAKARIGGAVEVQTAAISQVVDVVAKGLRQADRVGPVATIFVNTSVVSGGEASEIARLLSEEAFGADAFLSLDMSQIDAYSHIYQLFCGLVEALRSKPRRVVFVSGVDLSDGRSRGLLADIIEAAHAPKSATAVTLADSVLIVAGDRFPASIIPFDLLLLLRRRRNPSVGVSDIPPAPAPESFDSRAADIVAAQANLTEFQNGFPDPVAG